MIDKKEFASIKKDLDKFEQIRESAIQNSRIIIKQSKEIIYALHRNDIKKAEQVIPEIKQNLKKLPKANASNPGQLQIH